MILLFGVCLMCIWVSVHGYDDFYGNSDLESVWMLGAWLGMMWNDMLAMVQSKGRYQM